MELGTSLPNNTEGLFLLHALFRQSFGFVCTAYTQREQAEGFLARARDATGKHDGPFSLLPCPHEVEVDQ